jgi:hypothetical protein
MPEWLQVVALVASPLFAAGGAFAATRVTLKWHEREIGRAHARLDDHDTKFDQLEWVRRVAQ